MTRVIVTLRYMGNGNDPILDTIPAVGEVFRQGNPVILDAEEDDEWNEILRRFGIDDFEDLPDYARVMQFNSEFYRTTEEKEAILAKLREDHPHGFFI